MCHFVSAIAQRWDSRDAGADGEHLREARNIGRQIPSRARPAGAASHVGWLTLALRGTADAVPWPVHVTPWFEQSIHCLLQFLRKCLRAEKNYFFSLSRLLVYGRGVGEEVNLI